MRRVWASVLSVWRCWRSWRSSPGLARPCRSRSRVPASPSSTPPKARDGSARAGRARDDADPGSTPQQQQGVLSGQAVRASARRRQEGTTDDPRPSTFSAMGTTCELAVAASPEDEPQAQRAAAGTRRGRDVRARADPLQPDQRPVTAQWLPRRVGRCRRAARRCAARGCGRASGDRRAVRPDDPPSARRCRIRPHLRRADEPPRESSRRLAVRRGDLDRRGPLPRAPRARQRRRPRWNRQRLLSCPRARGDAARLAGADRWVRRPRRRPRVFRQADGRGRLARRRRRPA